MRIIAGQRRGYKFDGPRDQSIRPTSDLVREAIFNILGDSVDGLLVVDLFAGTGALGLEALSRGAERAIFVDKNRDHAALIRRNIATLRYEDRSTVIMSDAYRWGKTFEASPNDPVIVFVDPPYDDYEDRAERVHQLLANLIDRLPTGSILLSESRTKLDAEVLPDFDSWEIRRYGGTQIAIKVIGESDEPAESNDEPEPDDQESADADE